MTQPSPRPSPSRPRPRLFVITFATGGRGAEGTLGSTREGAAPHEHVSLVAGEGDGGAGGDGRGGEVRGAVGEGWRGVTGHSWGHNTPSASLRGSVSGGRKGCLPDLT